MMKCVPNKRFLTLSTWVLLHPFFFFFIILPTFSFGSPINENASFDLLVEKW